MPKSGPSTKGAHVAPSTSKAVEATPSHGPCLLGHGAHVAPSGSQDAGATPSHGGSRWTSAGASPWLTILEKLREMHGNPRVELNFSNPLELAVAAILSAQCTDQRVNQVTEQLFKKYGSVTDYVDADQGELEDLVRPTGFYRNKARSLKSFASDVEARFGGVVPDDIDTLTTVKGIGRKTASMVVGVAFGKPAMIVETHVMRVAKRIGLTGNDEAEKIEEDLKRMVPEAQWTDSSLLLILHGRYVCVARKPRCMDCLLREDCDYWAGNGEMAKG